MIAPLTRELLVYSAQIGVLVAACAIAMRASRLPYPQARLACWRIVLAACLLLPLWPAHVVRVTIPAGPPMAMPAAPASTFMTAASPALPPLARHDPWTAAALLNLLPMLVLAGALARVVWLSAGVVALRRLAASAGAPIETRELLDLRARMGSPASMRWHDSIEQPIAFGVWPPSVLLPGSLRDKPTDVQCAALSHELLHVARNDWLTGVVEQLVLCAFWFHPAVWWLMDQLELHREQVVDDLSIAAVGSRKDYLRALLEFADKPSPGIALAFGHRQLARRIHHLSREIVMTRSRFALSTVALTIVMSASVFTVASAIPLRTETQYGVVAARGFGARTITRPANEPRALAQAQTGPAHVPSGGIADLQRRAAEVARRLDAETQAVRNALVGGNQPGLGVLPVYPEQALTYGVGATIRVSARVTVTGQLVDIKPAAWSLTISRDITDVAYWAAAPQKAFFDAATDAMRSWQGTPGGDETAIAATFTFNPNGPIVTAGIERRLKDGTVLSNAHGGGGTRPSGWDQHEAVRVGGDIPTPRKIQNVNPVYPPVARENGVGGIVIIDTTIGADGSVIDARIVRSVPLLDQAALDAIRQWKYEPTIKDGVAIPVRTTVTVNFSLRK